MSTSLATKTRTLIEVPWVDGVYQTYQYGEYSLWVDTDFSNAVDSDSPYGCVIQDGRIYVGEDTESAVNDEWIILPVRGAIRLLEQAIALDVGKSISSYIDILRAKRNFYVLTAPCGDEIVLRKSVLSALLFRLRKARLQK